VIVDIEGPLGCKSIFKLASTFTQEVEITFLQIWLSVLLGILVRILYMPLVVFIRT
jgi:hypothetical protein